MGDLFEKRPVATYYSCPVCHLVLIQSPEGVVNGRWDSSLPPAGGYVCDEGHAFEASDSAVPATGFCLDCSDWVVLEWASGGCPRGHPASSVVDVADSALPAGDVYPYYGHPWQPRKGDFEPRRGELRRVDGEWRAFGKEDLERIRGGGPGEAARHRENEHRRTRDGMTAEAAGSRETRALVVGLLLALAVCFAVILLVSDTAVDTARTLLIFLLAGP